MKENIWSCKIGGDIPELPHGADAPMREAVYNAFKKINGVPPAFIFSGWGATLTKGERAVHENREPDPEPGTMGAIYFAVVSDNAKLRAELKTADSFYKVTVQQRDAAWAEAASLRAELAECKQDAKHRITRLRDALANLHGNCYVADAPTEMIAAEEALAAEALDAARKGERESE